jgi:hypothetical protein
MNPFRRNDPIAALSSKLDDQTKLLLSLMTKVNSIMATMQDVQAAVAAETTIDASAVALIKGLAAQVAALAPNQAAIDALASQIQAQSADLAAAVASNTPAA